MRVQGDVTGHGLVEVVLRASVLGRVPALERVAGAGRVGRLRGLGPVLHRLRGDRGTAVRIERHRVGPDGPVRVHGRICGPHCRGRADLASAVLGRVPALERVAGPGGRRQSAILAAVLYGPGRFGRLAAVAVEGECVCVDGPVRVDGRIRGTHHRTHIHLGSAVLGCVPALERVSGAHGRGQGSV